VYPIKKIKLIIQSACHVIGKGESACHVSKNAQSAGLWGILKKKYFTRTESDQNISQGEKPKVTYITGVKAY